MIDTHQHIGDDASRTCMSILPLVDRRLMQQRPRDGVRHVTTRVRKLDSTGAGETGAGRPAARTLTLVSTHHTQKY